MSALSNTSKLPTIEVVLSPVFARRHRCLSLALSAIFLCATGATAHAQPAPSKANSDAKAWSNLTAAQQQALSPLQNEWAGIDATRKAKWVEIAGRLPSMPAEEQQRVRARMTEWAKLSPSERGQARLNFKEAQNVPAPDRKAKWEAYKALPPSQQQELAARAAATSAPAREAGKRSELPPVRPSSASTPAQRPKSVAPTLVQPGPGATTNLVTQRPTKPVLSAQSAASRPAVGASAPARSNP
jgi:hypothetical protein